MLYNRFILEIKPLLIKRFPLTTLCVCAFELGDLCSCDCFDISCSFAPSTATACFQWLRLTDWYYDFLIESSPNIKCPAASIYRHPQLSQSICSWFSSCTCLTTCRNISVPRCTNFNAVCIRSKSNRSTFNFTFTQNHPHHRNAFRTQTLTWPACRIDLVALNNDDDPLSTY